ncbi:hypothetical protein B296_00008002 [Ensete ventricosum]|uniref:Uncharacterized protein n=1 Tax=Ensete ventricosum TaxID=4639 RepID=A0A426Z4I9_ENSVE|nr:hypothetical protein B296_00008002 [Ensete ventricosum]
MSGSVAVQRRFDYAARRGSGRTLTIGLGRIYKRTRSRASTIDTKTLVHAQYRCRLLHRSAASAVSRIQKGLI